VRAIDGRTLQGLGRQIKATEGNEQYDSVNAQLREIRDDVDVCKLFHQPGVMEVEDSDLDPAVDRIAVKLSLKDWPMESINSMLSRKLVQHKKEERYEELVKGCDPFLSEALNLKNPRVGAIPNITEAAKMAICTRVLFRELFFGLVAKGREGLPAVKAVSVLIDAQFNKYDALDISSSALPVLKEYLALGRCFLALSDFTHGLEYKDCFHEMFHSYIYCIGNN